ncbi:MAG TPA: hypothetical protein DIW47_04270 [Bacteroidetes bacterium]|nr:hypothetical protein [Bacteroidota bacterium]
MKMIYTTLLLWLFSGAVNAQTFVSLVNSPSGDLDALVSSKTEVEEEDNTYQNSPDIGCGTWTYGNAGTGKNRCFLNFDWSRIPGNAIIISAELDLYSKDTGWIIHGGHMGENESFIKRVVDNWDAATVTWNNQPGAANTAAVTLAKSTTSDQDYLNIDVTGLVKAMQATNSWYGFVFISKNENDNGVLSFVSSNSSDSTKRPRLRITYSVPTSIESMKSTSPKVTIYPNPSSNPTIAVSEFEDGVELRLFTFSGQKIGTTLKFMERGSLQLSEFTNGENLAKGIYIVRVRTSTSELSEKIVIQ